MSTEAKWDQLLTQFEAGLDNSDGVTADWEPAGGPIPAHMVERAQRLAARFEARVQRLLDEFATARAQLGAVNRVPELRPETAVYVECDG